MTFIFTTNNTRKIKKHASREKLFFRIVEQKTNENITVLNRKIVIIFSFLLVFSLESCVSIDKFNSQINTTRSVKELKSDVDYVQHKLEKLHPDLYHYITKDDFNYKFDSLRSSLTTSMTSNDFYFKISPVIASIKQGHTQISPLTRKLNSTEKKIANHSGTSPLNLFEFELFENKLYIIKNNSKDSTIKSGTEVISVNGVKPQDIINKYVKTFSSDGYNSTFIPRKLAKGFPRYFYLQNGIMDSIYCTISYKDSIRNILLKRLKKPKSPATKKTKEQLIQDKKWQQIESKKRRLLGYDVLLKKYSKQLSFPVKDSSIAIMKISDFTKGNYNQFYKMSFRKLDSLKTKVLIIDLRDNGGGRLLDVYNLYSYLSDSSFHFLDKSEVTSKTSLWHIGFFNGKTLLQQASQIISLPFIVGWDVCTYFMTIKGKDNKYRFSMYESWLRQPNSQRFKGKVYVLINGGCFSATSLLSSNLQGAKRAMFVGMETGGANNGCVAGYMPISTLPKSKLTIKFGLIVCQTDYKSKIDGRGIFPDVEIQPNLADRISGTDPEMKWVLNDIKGIQQQNTNN